MGKGSNSFVSILPKMKALRIIRNTESNLLKGSLLFLLPKNFATKTGVIKANGQLNVKAIAIDNTTPTKNRNILISLGDSCAIVGKKLASIVFINGHLSS